MTTEILLFLDMLLITIVVTIFFLAKWTWHWYNGTIYNRDTKIGDIHIFLASVAVPMVVQTVLPIVEQACFTVGQQEIIGVFRVIPAFFLAISILGLLVERDPNKLKITVSILIGAGLVFGIVRTITNLEPCSDPNSLDEVDLSFF